MAVGSDPTRASLLLVVSLNAKATVSFVFETSSSLMRCLNSVKRLVSMVRSTPRVQDGKMDSVLVDTALILSKLSLRCSKGGALIPRTRLSFPLVVVQ